MYNVQIYSIIYTNNKYINKGKRMRSFSLNMKKKLHAVHNMKD